MRGMPPRESGDPGIPDLRAARSALPKRRGGARTAVVLAADGAGGRLAGWLAALAEDRVTVLPPDPNRLTGHVVPVRRAATLDEVLDHLRRAGSVDLVVNLSGQPPPGCIDHRTLLLALLPYLAKRGAVVHDRVAVPDAGDGGRGLAGVLDRDASARDVGVVVTPELVVVQQRRRRLLMLRERDVPDVLATREPSLSVDELAALPEG